jgi:menaquinone-dependent protoporphyrinogen oxidase
MTFSSSTGRGPRVLVAFGSRHGGTREIAATLARGLTAAPAGRRSGLSVALAPVEQRPDPMAFDAVVLGSPVYGGRWLAPVVDYVREVFPGLCDRPTWLFSSGMEGVSSALLPATDDARWIGACIDAREHRTFAGRLETRLLSAAERDAWTAGPQASGDFRDRAAVHGWAERIASDLGVRQAAPVG